MFLDQDETIVDAAILDLRVVDKSADEQELPILFLTKARSMVCTLFPITPKHVSLRLLRSQTSELIPMIHLRFASVAVSDTVAKESRVKASLHGFTLLVADGVAWMNDVASFVKAPPGVCIDQHFHRVYTDDADIARLSKPLFLVNALSSPSMCPIARFSSAH